MEKAAAREEMRARRKALGAEERETLQSQALTRLLSVPELHQAEWVYPFVSCRTEIDTWELIRSLLKQEKQRIAVPRVEGTVMEFVEIHAWQDLQPGTMGILEPVDGEVVAAAHGVMLIPGLAFDRTGNRVGYGAGYYDKYLEQHDGADLYTLAYAFDFQVVDQIGAEAHDRKVDAIVTDQGFYRF